MSPKQDAKSGKTSTNNLVALGSIAVLGVYAAGYARTAAAADRFAQAAQRHPAAVIARSDNGSTAQVQPLPMPAAGTSAGPASAATSAPVAGKTAAASPAAAKASAAADAAVKVAAAAAQPSSTTASTAASSKAAPIATGAAVKDSATAAKPVITAKPTVVAATTDRTDPAPAKVVAPPPVDSAAIAREAEKQRVVWKDGAYVGYGTSRHGDIEATIEVKGGKIISASISDCRTQYSCSWISALPPQVLTRQSAEVDYVSGATQSSNAFYAAVVDALSKAK